MDTLTTVETTGTKALPPRHDYRRLAPVSRPLLVVIPFQTVGFLLPFSPTATVTDTGAGTYKGSVKAESPLARETEDTSTSSDEYFGMQGEGEWAAQVSVPTDVSAAALVQRVSAQAVAGRISAGEVSDLLFPFLFDDTAPARRLAFAALGKFATPMAILDTAFRTYRLQKYEGYLEAAAALLGHYGRDAWPAIRRWARLGGSECESLVETAFSMAEVPTDEFLAGLKDLVRLGDHNTRQRAIDALHLLDESVQSQLLREIAESGEPDDPTRDEARDRLSE